MPASHHQIAASRSAVGPALLSSGSKTETLRVLLLEGDELHRETLTAELSKLGFAIRSFSDGASLVGSLDAAGDADVIILDWRLAETAGIDLLLRLHKHRVNLPVVFLTGHANESVALDMGAIDSGEGLVKRLNRAVEAARPETALPPEEQLVRGKLVLKPEARRAYWKGIDLDLSLGEYNIVHLLASKPGNFVTYRAIYDRLHHEGFIAGFGPDGYRANVRSIIKRIRNKFRERDPFFAEIENYTGFGYCWRKPD